MKAVFESRQEFFQQGMAEGVVQDNTQTLREKQDTDHKVVQYPVYCQ